MGEMRALREEERPELAQVAGQFLVRPAFHFASDDQHNNTLSFAYHVAPVWRGDAW